MFSMFSKNAFARQVAERAKTSSTTELTSAFARCDRILATSESPSEKRLARAAIAELEDEFNMRHVFSL